jgi:glycosyltransferase involved in cell wall biosynthesis
MASHNAAPFVCEAIESVLEQTYELLELIVVDDSSSDGTTEIIAGYADREPQRLRFKPKRVREGPCRARNEALGLARGSLVSWIDHDDLWMPTKVEEQVGLLDERPEVGLVYSYFDAFESQSGQEISWPDGRRDLQGDVLADLLLIGCFIGSITSMFRRQALDRSGGQLRQRDFSIGDDYYLWLTIALEWPVARIPRVLARYRRHDANESARVASSMDFQRWRAALVQEFLDEYPEARQRLGPRDRWALARYLIRAARLELAAGQARQATREARSASMLAVSRTLRPTTMALAAGS